MRLTHRGLAVAVLAVVCYGAGVWLAYPLLRVLGGTAAVAVVLAVVLVGRVPAVEVERTVAPERVGRGDPALARLVVRNATTTRRPGFRALDRVGASTAEVAVRALASGASAVQHYELGTERRGRLVVGPLRLVRRDPLGLAARALGVGSTATLWVYPRRHPVHPAVGVRARHHHEGPIVGPPLSGSMDLRRLREYVVGDEMRHLHWKATARTGKLMVREYIDPNQPRFTALLDTRAAQMPAELFEDAVDLAASLVSAAALADHKCRLVTPCGVDAATTGGAPAVRQLLDELCVLERCTEAAALVPGQLARAEGGSLAIVLSAMTDADRASLASLAARFSNLIVIVLSGQTGASVPGVRMLSATSAASAVERWNAVMAR